MSEKLSIDAKLPPAYVADDAVGVPLAVMVLPTTITLIRLGSVS